MQWKINNTVICLRPQVIFRSPLLKLHYYHNKQLQVKEFQVPYQPTVESLPQYPNWTYSVVIVPLSDARLPST